MRAIFSSANLRTYWRVIEKSIVLIGFMGAGKSAVGRELERRTGLPRYDTDEIIRRRFGLSIPDIFAQHGEQAFRDTETMVLKSLRGRSIVVTGGGIVMRPENVAALRTRGQTFWLHADEEILWKRAAMRSTRPLLHTDNPRERFTTLLRERLPLYEAAADYKVDSSSREIGAVADSIIALL